MKGDLYRVEGEEHMAQLQPYCAIEGNDDGLPVVFVHGMGVWTIVR